MDEMIDGQHVSEKELSWSFSRGPMEMLLSPPEELLDDDASICDSNIGSALSIRTISVDSIPSLGDSFTTDQVSSLDGSSPLFRRRASSLRKSSFEPVRSPPNSIKDHPLSATADSILEDWEVNIEPTAHVTEDAERFPVFEPLKPLKAVFKSNLTASLRALRSAAKSFSSFNFPSLPPDDFLARSLLTIDPNVPYTDERRPPVTEELPSAELRRYLNPIPSRQHEPQPKNASQPGNFSASIQMQTYKVQRSRATSPNPRPQSSIAPVPTQESSTPVSNPPSMEKTPAMRQREMRENSDFIRVAVMEMAMRKRGKLDDQRPGRARWALPPRKASMRPYAIRTDGIPERWVPITVDA